MSRLHDRLHLLKIVDVESRDAVAVFRGMVEQKSKRNERHSEVLTKADKRTCVRSRATLQLSRVNVTTLRGRKHAGVSANDGSVGVSSYKKLLVR